MVKIITKNKDKFMEAKLILDSYGIIAEQVELDVVEIQSESLEEIAKDRVIKAAKLVEPPIVTEDAGLFIEALRGFPGPYSSYVYKTIGCKGIIKLMDGLANRKAKFVSVVAYMDESKEIHLFRGELSGVISSEVRGESGFGFDPIFMPITHRGKTISELGISEKNKISHRAKSFKKLAEYLLRKSNPRS